MIWAPPSLFNGCEKGAHKFEARYDEVPRGIDHFKGRYATAEELKVLLNYRIYVHDVCVRCGKVIRRGDHAYD